MKAIQLIALLAQHVDNHSNPNLEVVINGVPVTHCWFDYGEENGLPQSLIHIESTYTEAPHAPLCMRDTSPRPTKANNTSCRVRSGIVA